ncbi:MAG: response regulator transcription factor [Actinomycetes bacterium]
MHILLVEDDDRIAAALRAALNRHGMTTTRLAVGRGAAQHLDGVDAVLLDLGMPDVDGIEVCRAMRAVSEVPILVVTGRADVEDRIRGLEAGADDYLVKPYDIGELVARVHTVYRRRRPELDSACDVVVIDDVEIDLRRHAVAVAGDPVSLTRKEFQVLSLLASVGGAVCPRARIVAEIWGRAWPGANSTLDVHIAVLRSKLGRPDLVQTVRGVGYRLAHAVTHSEIPCRALSAHP